MNNSADFLKRLSIICEAGPATLATAPAAPVDVQGKEFVIGDKVAKAAKYFQMDGLHIVVATVTNIVGHKLYLDNSRQPMKFPDRLAILDR